MCQGEKERPGALGQLGHPLGDRENLRAASEQLHWKLAGSLRAPHSVCDLQEVACSGPMKHDEAQHSSPYRQQ